jgi:putative membrane protein
MKLPVAISVAQILMLLIALLHFYFLVLEMFLWRTRARKLFGMSAEKAEATAQLAQNQGLYNGFLAAGLVWAVFSATDFAPRATFFLVCVALAGIFGAVTVTRRIFYVQAVPALAALVLLFLGRG